MKERLYRGVEEETWNELMYDAEDLLINRDLGTHLLGAYPLVTTKVFLTDEYYMLR